MATTGAIIAGTGTSVARGTNTAWTNPGNITANDGTVASCNSGTTGSAYLRASNFGFNIPANSVIQGFTVVFDMAESSTGTETVSVQIVGAAATAIGTAKTQIVNGTTLTLYTLGSGSDLWGTTGLTATDLNDTDFGVYLWYTTTHNTTVDYISIDVTYTPPVTGSLAATESGSDTAVISGKVFVKGSLAVTETGTDTAAFNGTVTGGSITGSLAATETGSDTAAIAGVVKVSGSLAATESGNDTATISGAVYISGSLSATETGEDIAAIAGAVRVSGSLDATESGEDTAAILGFVRITGALDATETGEDVAHFATAGAAITGSLSATEEGLDTASFTGITVVKPSGGGFVRVISRSSLKKAAERLLAFMTDPVIEQTPRVKKVIKRLKKIKDKPTEKVLQEITDSAIIELEAQKKLSEFMVEIRQIQETIAYLKKLKHEMNDDDEEAMMMLL